MANGRGDIVSGENHERAGRLVGADGVHEDHVARVLEVGEEREAQRPAVQDERPVGRFPIPLEPRDRGRPQPVVPAQKIPQPQNQQ